jgi:N-acetylmuramate 1-kinase
MGVMNSNLVVRVFSFSYKRGIPEDVSGNGGGFVFDCRAIENPGRYDEYKQLTGLDRPVIDFLEENGEIVQFMEQVIGLVNPSVERYMQRGFTDLMVSFGCTGGQHRSVYAAQHLAEYLHTRFGVEVALLHREQEIAQVFNRREA